MGPMQSESRTARAASDTYILPACTGKHAFAFDVIYQDSTDLSFDQWKLGIAMRY